MTNKQKAIRDKKVEKLTVDISDKQKQIDLNVDKHNQLISTLQSEKEEMEVLKLALESLK